MKGHALVAQSRNLVNLNGRNNTVKPFLRWAGGKRHLVKHLKNYLPVDGYKAYWEPFLGSASLFFSLAPKNAFLSDINSELIECYKHIQTSPELVYRYLREHIRLTSKEYYYKIRDQYNRSRPSAAQAARFIFLNRTSFNGIHRVNMQGKYNVPYGYKEPPPMPSMEGIKRASRLLRNASIASKSFVESLNDKSIKPGDFIYLDPPYPPHNTKTANFTHYTSTRFLWKDHEEVYRLAHLLAERGCSIMVSNSDTANVRELFNNPYWIKHTLPVTRFIAANGSREKVNELVITNY